MRRRARYVSDDPRRVAAACRLELSEILLDQRIEAPRSAALLELGELLDSELEVGASLLVEAAGGARFAPPRAAARGRSSGPEPRRASPARAPPAAVAVRAPVGRALTSLSSQRVTLAVVLAAGLGTRLRPLSERWAKPILPIDGRPVIVSLLHQARWGASTPSSSSPGIWQSGWRSCSLRSRTACASRRSPSRRGRQTRCGGRTSSRPTWSPPPTPSTGAEIRRSSGTGSRKAARPARSRCVASRAGPWHQDPRRERARCQGGRSLGRRRFDGRAADGGRPAGGRADRGRPAGAALRARACLPACDRRGGSVSRRSRSGRPAT